MTEFLLLLLQKHRRSGVLVDTNLLLLYIVGSVDERLISKIPRTTSYSFDDFYRLSKFVDAFDRKITTPHLLTQVTDLLGNRSDLNAATIGYIKLAWEVFASSESLCDTRPFDNFGLADAAVVAAASDGGVVLTDDGDLYGFLTNSGVDVVNLNHIRLIPLNG